MNSQTYIKSYIILLLFLGISLGAWADGSVTITFSEGSTPKSQRGVTTNVLFDDVTTTVDLTVSGCVIVPGERTYNDTRLVDFYGCVGNALKLSGANKLDCETFYFLKDYTQEGNDVQTDLNGKSLYAYTFTGWYIKGSSPLISLPTATTYVPAQTVFQPGDVITPDILKRNGIVNDDGKPTGTTLELVALWGKCCFIKDGGNDSNTGNDSAKPKASGTSAANALANQDAYASVAMLTGKYTFSGSYNPASYGITYKSLQTTDGAKCEFYASGNSQPSCSGNWRIDNVLGTKKGNQSMRSVGNTSYMETTARYSGSAGQLLRLENTSQNYVCVINGGNTVSGEVFGYTTSSNFKTRYFYFGRNATYATFYCSPSGSSGSTTGDCYVYVTGGVIENIQGTTNTGVTYNTGSGRYFYMYGNKSGNTEYDPKVNVFIVAKDKAVDKSKMYINGCTNLENVYGGAYSYTATLPSTDLTILNSVVNGSVYGAGFCGNVNGTAKTVIKNSVIKGNVYGGSMGGTSETTASEGNNSANISVAPTDFPTYYTTASGDYPQYTVLGIKISQISVWGGNRASKSYNKNYIAYRYFLSTAACGSSDLEIENSTIGTKETKNTTTNGNVYGGGNIAQVSGNCKVKLTDCTVYSDVYGGSDGVTEPASFCVDYPVTSGYVAPTEQEAYDRGDNGVSYQHPNHLEDTEKDYVNGEHYGKKYKWTADITVLNNGGFDHTNRLAYSPEANSWGNVSGSTDVSIIGGTVYGSVFGGGNSGKVGGNTSVTIVGSANVKQNVYGGGNAAEVSGTTKVQIGEKKK